jgi:Fe-S-cluster containining protein
MIDPEVAGQLRILFNDLDAEVAGHSPRCALSGNCCRFKEYDHTLFLSKVEADYLLALAPAPVRPLDEGQTCPWQDLAGRCTAREARPLGCRVFFCDPEYEPHAGPITEHYLARLKRTCEEHGLPWGYAPLHWHLRAAGAEGRFPDAPGTPAEPRADARAMREVLDTNPSGQYS